MVLIVPVVSEEKILKNNTRDKEEECEVMAIAHMALWARWAKNSTDWSSRIFRTCHDGSIKKDKNENKLLTHNLHFGSFFKSKQYFYCLQMNITIWKKMKISYQNFMGSKQILMIKSNSNKINPNFNFQTTDNWNIF